MKEIMGNEARIYSYMESVFKTVSSYYNYEYVMVSGDAIKKLSATKEFKKYCYLESNNEFNFLALNTDTIYQDAEAISMSYRVLEELKLEDITAYIKASDNYNLKKLQDYLMELDVDIEVSNTSALQDKNTLMSFEIVIEVKDKRIVLASGHKDSKYIVSINHLANILEVLNVIYEDYEFDTITQVTIVNSTEEERIVGMKLAQDLRWCEIKVDVDTNNRSREEQLKNINSNFTIDIIEDNLNKGLIKVIDNKTAEESFIDEAEIIDYIVSNI